MSRDAEKHEFRGSLSIACGRKINLGNYESAELQVWLTRRYDDDEPEAFPDATLMKNEAKKILDDWEDEERARAKKPDKPKPKYTPRKSSKKFNFVAKE